MDTTKFQMKELTKSELSKVEGGILWTIASVIFWACVDNPNDFMDGLKDASR